MRGWFLKPRSANAEVAQLVEKHYDELWRFCARWVGREDDGDITQETFMTAQKTWHRFEGRSTPKTWLFGIGQNLCRAHNRSRKRECFSEDLVLEEQTDRDPNLIDKITLEAAMGKLSHEHREVVVLHELHGFVYTEIAELLGIPEGTVKSRLHHAFAHLRRQLGVQEETR